MYAFHSNPLKCGFCDDIPEIHSCRQRSIGRMQKDYLMYLMLVCSCPKHPKGTLRSHLSISLFHVLLTSPKDRGRTPSIRSNGLCRADVPKNAADVSRMQRGANVLIWIWKLKSGCWILEDLVEFAWTFLGACPWREDIRDRHHGVGFDFDACSWMFMTNTVHK